MGVSPFPVFKTKIEGESRKFQLEDPIERRLYFDFKAGEEIKKLRLYLERGTFLGILLGPKNSGKGTYAKLFMEAVGSERIAHLSVGDIVRSVHASLTDSVKKEKLENFLKRRYRGFIDLDKTWEIIEGRDTKTLLPTETILALMEYEISGLGRKAVFVDGFPRNLDQVSYSLYLRALIGYRDDPDFLVFIDVPEAVIDERMRYRVVCPLCQTPRNTKLLRTKEVEYDQTRAAFYLLCDNPTCSGYGKTRLTAKEGDDLGIEAVRERIEADWKVIKTLLNLKGVPKILLRNSVPADMASQYVDDYEITPAYRYEHDEKSGRVRVIEEPWIINDDEGVKSYSLLPAAVAVSLLKQTAQVLGL